MTRDFAEDWPALLGGEPSVRTPPPHFRWPLIGSAEEEAVIALLRTNQLSYPRLEGAVAEFENAFRGQLGSSYAITTHSGTAALHAAYFALGLPPGTEVIVPAYTHIGTALPLLHVGLVPVLCDVDPDTGNILPAAIEQAMSPRTGAVVVTHQFGLSCAMDEIVSLVRRHGLRLVEDCSHAHGARYRNAPVGTRGDVACFSLQAHKGIVAGEGGILVTNDARIAERAALLGHFREPREFSSAEWSAYVETGFGLKSRLHPVAAVLALAGLRQLPRVCVARGENYRLLQSALAGIASLAPLPTPPDCERGAYFRFILRFRSEDFAGLSAPALTTALHAEGAIEARPGSLARPLHSYRIFQDSDFSLYARPWQRGGDPLAGRPSYRIGDFPGAEAFSAGTLQLPAWTEPSETLIDEYARALRKVQRHAASIRERKP